MSFKLVIISILITVSSGRNPMPDKTDNNFENDCLQTHNNYRRMHGVPGLSINRNLINYAKSRCQSRSRQEGLSAGHSGLANGIGENIFWGGNSRPVPNTCGQAVKLWYDEIKHYNYNKPGFGMSTGHFTQVVWKSTTTVGCARCFGRGSKWYETYIICNYKPPGNYQGQFPQNVLRPRSG